MFILNRIFMFLTVIFIDCIVFVIIAKFWLKNSTSKLFYTIYIVTFWVYYKNKNNMKESDSMKRLFTVLVSVFLAVIFIFPASAIVIDGYAKGQEWSGSSYYLIMSSPDNSGCAIQFADLQVKLSDDSKVCMLFQVVDSEFNEDVSGVRVTIGGHSYNLTANCIKEYQNVKYVSHCNEPVEVSGFVIEAAFTLAQPLEGSISFSVSAVDGSGAVSKRITGEIAGSGSDVVTEPERTSASVKTTAPKTTKHETTKRPKTTAEKTTKQSPKTSSKTTKRSKKSVSSSYNKATERKSGSIFKSRLKSRLDNTEINGFENGESAGTLNGTDLNINLEEENIKQPNKYKTIAGVVVFILLTVFALAAIIPKKYKRSEKDKSPDANKK